MGILEVVVNAETTVLIPEGQIRKIEHCSGRTPYIEVTLINGDVARYGDFLDVERFKQHLRDGGCYII